MLMRSSGDPKRVQRGLAEQTWAWEAVCHKEELHRVQRQESQGDSDFWNRYRPLCHCNTMWKAKGIAWEKHQIRMNDGDDDGGWPSSTWLESITFETGKRSQGPPWHQTFRIIDTCLSQNQTALKPDWPWMPLPTSNKDILHFSFGASLAGPLYQRYVGQKKAGRYHRVGPRMTITERHLW